MQISGYVKEIYEGTTKTGRSAGKPFWSITLDTDAKLTCFNAEFMSDVVEGKEYTFTYEKSGDYINLTAPSVPVISVDSETTSPDSTTGSEALTAPPVDELPQRDKGVFKSNFPSVGTASNKDEAIRKAVALKAAVEFSDSVAGSTGNIKKVIEYAKEFEKYLEGNSGDDNDVPF